MYRATIRRHIAFVSLLLSLPTVGRAWAQAAAAKAPGFPIPAAVVALSRSITPHQYVEVVAAIKQEIAKPAVREELDKGAGLGTFDWISVSQVALGSLGEGLVVNFGHSPSCGNGGCPMWLLLRHSSRYTVAIRSGGWGYSLLHSAGSVPDIVFYWHMSAAETDVARYHYAKGRFIPVVARPDKCSGGEDEGGVCTENAALLPLWSITPAEYEGLALEVRAGSSHRNSQPSFADAAHALDFRLVNDTIARVVGIGNCTIESNCAISIYSCNQTYPAAGSANLTEANLPRCEYWPMLTGVSGWGVANVSDWDSDPFSPKVAFVIARRLSATEVELKKYTAPSPPAGPQPGKMLTLDSCEVVSPRNEGHLSPWDPEMLRVRPEPCN